MLSKSTARVGRARVLVPLAAVAALALVPLLVASPRAHAEQPPIVQPSAQAPVASAPAAVAPPVPARERTAVWLAAEDTKLPPILAYPPHGPSPRAPLMMMLHGMCDAPQNECPSFAVPSTSGTLLVCPRANLQCDGGGTIWSGDPRIRSALVHSYVQRVHTSFPGRVDDDAATLVGFSLGSFVALDVAQRSQGQWKNLVLIGAKIEPDARLLQRAGIQNVLLASGDRDMMKWHMVGEASKLRRRGVRATYKSMGDVGHWFARDMDAWLAEAQQWLDGNEIP